MTDILVRGVPESVLGALKERAARNRRSLQQEVLGILETAAHEPEGHTGAEVAAAIRRRLTASGRQFEDSVPSLRDDRAR
jgi:plasmid stability protein